MYLHKYGTPNSITPTVTLECSYSGWIGTLEWIGVFKQPFLKKLHDVSPIQSHSNPFEGLGVATGMDWDWDYTNLVLVERDLDFGREESSRSRIAERHPKTEMAPKSDADAENNQPYA